MDFSRDPHADNTLSENYSQVAGNPDRFPETVGTNERLCDTDCHPASLQRKRLINGFLDAFRSLFDTSGPCDALGTRTVALKIMPFRVGNA